MSPLVPLIEPTKGENAAKIHFAKMFPQSVTLHTIIIQGEKEINRS